jgi:SAM-dependent methyltransferase
VGAGTGIASYAFARSGAREVVALEPDPSDVIGQGAIRRLVGALPIVVEGGWGEALPFADGRFDLVYLRQVLHHARDLDALVRECARVAAPGGVVIATREHVVDDERQLAEFLATHPVHRLAGGEHAFALPAYVAAFRRAGLAPLRVLGPLDSGDPGRGDAPESPGRRARALPRGRGPARGAGPRRDGPRAEGHRPAGARPPVLVRGVEGVTGRDAVLRRLLRGRSAR